LRNDTFPKTERPENSTSQRRKRAVHKNGEEMNIRCPICNGTGGVEQCFGTGAVTNGGTSAGFVGNYRGIEW